jgi:hypothetical protein
MKKYDVLKANSLAELIQMVKESIVTGLTALGIPEVVYIRNTRNKRVPVYYQAVAMAYIK